MKVSVIIPTYNGAHKILGLLRSLEQQSQQPDEVIVVVDGSTDETVRVLQQGQFSFTTFSIIEQENSGRAKVRNRGAKEASGDLLIFFDDDMLPEPDCVAIHFQHHEKNKGSILTGAQIDSAGDSDIQQYKAGLSLKWSKPLQQKQGTPLDKESIFITAANFSIAKNLFFQLQGFDEQLTDAEDFDLAVRANQQGIKLFYDHSAFAWHNDPITGRSYIKRLRQYRKSHERLRELKPALYTSLPMHTPVMPSGLKRKVFLFFSSKYWVSWLDSKNIIKQLLPRFIRYKFYDLITTANGVYYPEKGNLG